MMLGRLFGRSEPELPENHSPYRFIYIDWHMTGYLMVYKIDTPMPIGESQKPETSSADQKQIEQILQTMKQQGWQLIIARPYQEGWTKQFMKMPPVEDGYELCALTWNMSYTTPKKPIGCQLYRLGRRNENMLSYKEALAGFDSIVSNLAGQRWEVVSEEAFPASGEGLHLRLYRRRR